MTPESLLTILRTADHARAQAFLVKKGASIEDVVACAAMPINVTGTRWEPSAEGRDAILLPVADADGALVDIVAWLPYEPERWYMRVGIHGVLGWDELNAAKVYCRSVVVNASPLDWLLAGGKGCVALTVEAGVHFLGVPELVGSAAAGIVEECQRQFVIPRVKK